MGFLVEEEVLAGVVQTGNGAYVESSAISVRKTCTLWIVAKPQDAHEIGAWSGLAYARRRDRSSRPHTPR